MRDCINDPDKINRIDTPLVRTLWLSTGFVKFVFMFCARISHDMRSFINVLLQEDSNLFEHVTPSDIAWGVTTFTNTRDFWDYKNIKEVESVEDEGRQVVPGTGDKGGARREFWELRRMQSR